MESEYATEYCKKSAPCQIRNCSTNISINGSTKKKKKTTIFYNLKAQNPLQHTFFFIRTIL